MQFHSIRYFQPNPKSGEWQEIAHEEYMGTFEEASERAERKARSREYKLAQIYVYPLEIIEDPKIGYEERWDWTGRSGWYKMEP